MKIAVYFYNNRNRGSFELDALATTFQGEWDSRSSTPNSGIISGVDPENREWVEEVLNKDENVESYRIDVD